MNELDYKKLAILDRLYNSLSMSMKFDKKQRVTLNVMEVNGLIRVDEEGWIHLTEAGMSARQQAKMEARK